MNSKQAKLPPINSKTKILCFDLETNGLHGEVFAVGAVVMDASGVISDQFTGRTKIIGQVDAWVEQNVLPATQDMSITHVNYKSLREAFWRWFLVAEAKSDYVLVSNGYPVEYRFLLKCQEDNIDERYWQHPFPILDLTSLLIQAGDVGAIKRALNGLVMESEDFVPHHPLDDARKTALLAFHAFRIAK